MSKNKVQRDEIINCAKCNTSFTYTVVQQQDFTAKNWPRPIRCMKCSREVKNEKNPEKPPTVGRYLPRYCQNYKVGPCKWGLQCAFDHIDCRLGASCKDSTCRMGHPAAIVAVAPPVAVASASSEGKTEKPKETTTATVAGAWKGANPEAISTSSITSSSGGPSPGDMKQGGGVVKKEPPPGDIKQGGGVVKNDQNQREFMQEHVLHSTWNLWEHTDKGRKKEKLQPSFKTVEDFWRVWSLMPRISALSRLRGLDSFSLFKDGIEPCAGNFKDLTDHREWRFEFKIDRVHESLIDIVWEDLVAACLGEILEEGQNDEILGIRAVDRTHWKTPTFRLELWMRNPSGTPKEVAEKEANIMQIKLRMQAAIDPSLPVKIDFLDAIFQQEHGQPEQPSLKSEALNYTYDNRLSMFNPKAWEAPLMLQDRSKRRYEKAYFFSLFGNTRPNEGATRWIKGHYSKVSVMQHEPYGWRECEKFVHENSKEGLRKSDNSYEVPTGPILVIDQIKAILNGLSLENKDISISKILGLDFGVNELVKQTVEAIVAFAKDQKMFVALYAELSDRLCKFLEKRYPDAKSVEQNGKGFRHILESECREEFEKRITGQLILLANQGLGSLDEKDDAEKTLTDNYEGVTFLFADLCKREVFKAKAPVTANPLGEFLRGIMTESPACKYKLMTAMKVIERSFDPTFASKLPEIRGIALGLSRDVSTIKQVKFQYESLMKRADIWGAAFVVAEQPRVIAAPMESKMAEEWTSVSTSKKKPVTASASSKSEGSKGNKSGNGGKKGNSTEPSGRNASGNNVKSLELPSPTPTAATDATLKKSSESLQAFVQKEKTLTELEHEIKQLQLPAHSLVVQMFKRLSRDVDVEWTFEVLHMLFMKSMLTEASLLTGIKEFLTPSRIEDDGDVFYTVPYLTAEEDFPQMPKWLGVLLGNLQKNGHLMSSFLEKALVHAKSVEASTEGQCSISSFPVVMENFNGAKG